MDGKIAKLASFSKSILSDSSPSITASRETAERQWAFGYGAFIMLLTSLPYLVGYAAQGKDWHFNGFVFALEDLNSYIANMFSGSAGDWLFRAAYTIFPQRGVLMFLPYILLGKLASPYSSHEQLLAFFHLFRISAGLLAIVATYDFLSFFIHDFRIRRLGLVLATVGGGLGWVLVLIGKETWLGSMPLDFFSPEAFGFLQIFGIPHLALARAFLLWGLLLFLKAVWQYKQDGKAPSRIEGMKTGLVWLMAGLSQPLTGMVVGAVAGIYILAILGRQLWLSIRKRGKDWSELGPILRFTVIVGIFPAPLVLYSIWSFSTDAYLKAWVVQSTIYAPHPLHYLVAYGLILPFAFAGGYKLLRQDYWKGLFLSAWILAFPFLAYAPFSLQRRLIEGIWVALVTLALFFFEWVASKRNALAHNSWKVLVGLILFVLPSAIFLLTVGLLVATQPREPVFLPVEEVRAFQFINQEAPPRSVVLAAYGTGTVLPTWAPVKVVMGQSTESIGLEKIQPLVTDFYNASTTDKERQALLKEWGVDYVFWGPSERSLGDWDPHKAPYLLALFKEGQYEVFQVKDFKAFTTRMLGEERSY